MIKQRQSSALESTKKVEGGEALGSQEVNDIAQRVRILCPSSIVGLLSETDN